MATYKQPRAINAVSLTLFAIVGLAGYAAFAGWPILTLNADIKSAMEDALPRLYRANLLPEPESTTAADQIRQSLTEQLTQLGIEQADAMLHVVRDSTSVAIDVNVVRSLDLKWLHLKFPVRLHPHVETSAARVSY